VSEPSETSGWIRGCTFNLVEGRVMWRLWPALVILCALAPWNVAGASAVSGRDSTSTARSLLERAFQVSASANSFRIQWSGSGRFLASRPDTYQYEHLIASGDYLLPPTRWPYKKSSGRAPQLELSLAARLTHLRVKGAIPDVNATVAVSTNKMYSTCPSPVTAR